jgi:hypothetical protein
MNLQLKIACLDSMQEGTKYEAYKITISVFTQHIFPTHHPTPKTQLTHTPAHKLRLSSSHPSLSSPPAGPPAHSSLSISTFHLLTTPHQVPSKPD